MSSIFFHTSIDDIEYHPGYILQPKPLQSSDPQHAGEVAQINAVFPGGLSIWGVKMVNPGCWIEGEPTPEQQLMLDREADFEEIGCRLFPERPSRLQSLFGFVSEEDVQRFHKIRSLHDRRVWRVEAEEVFIGDMSLYDGYAIGQFKEVAKQYWAGERGPLPLLEAVMKLPAKVIDRIDISHDA